MASFRLVCATVLFMAVVSEAFMPCPEIDSAMDPCLGYLQYGALVPKLCCEGLVQIKNGSINYAFERIHACLCINVFLENIIDDAGVKYRAKSLPGKCDVDLHYEIGASMDDCYKVKSEGVQVTKIRLVGRWT